MHKDILRALILENCILVNELVILIIKREMQLSVTIRLLDY